MMTSHKDFCSMMASTNCALSLFQEAEQLKLVLKRELDRMEAELRTKDAIISDYKNITQILQVFAETIGDLLVYTMSVSTGKT